MHNDERAQFEAWKRDWLSTNTAWPTGWEVWKARAAIAQQPSTSVRDALQRLHAVVIRQNRLGASWHPEVFGDLMGALGNARALLNAPDEGAAIAQPAEPAEVMGYMVSTGDEKTAALYPVAQASEAVDAARRWNATITTLVASDHAAPSWQSAEPKAQGENHARKV